MYIIETCKKLNLPVDLEIFRAELKYWSQFVEFSLNDCSEEIEKYCVVEELNTNSRANEKNRTKSKSKMEAKIIDI